MSEYFYTWKNNNTVLITVSVQDFGLVGNAVRGLSLNQHTHNIVYSLLKSPFKSHCIITLDTTHSPDSTLCLLSLDLLIPYDARIDLID